MEPARIRKEEEMYLTENDLVKMGLNRKGKWQYTVADIEALPPEVYAELIDGEIFVWMQAPLRIHQDILVELLLDIGGYIRKNKGNCKIYPAPFGVYIKKDDRNFVMPDISVVCDRERLDEKGCQGAPDWAIEIVSPSNRSMDYKRKLKLYQESGVREYWIVDPRKQTVTVYNFEHDKNVEIHPFSERIKAGIYEDLYLDLSEYIA